MRTFWVLCSALFSATGVFRNATHLFSKPARMGSCSGSLPGGKGGMTCSSIPCIPRGRFDCGRPDSVGQALLRT